MEMREKKLCHVIIVKGGKRSYGNVCTYLCSVLYQSCSISLCYRENIFQKPSLPCPLKINDTHLMQTHLYVCDLQSAVVHQGQLGLICLNFFSVLLP